MRIATVVMRRVDKDDSFLRLLLHSALEDHDLAREFHSARVERVLSVLEERIRRMGGRRRRSPPVDPALAARAFHGMIFAAIMNRRIFHERVMRRTPIDRIARSIVKIFLEGIATVLLLALLATGPLAAGTADLLAEARVRGYASLGDCFRAALAKSERIGRAQEDLTQAELVKKTALAQVLPYVTAEGSYYRQNRVSFGGSPSPSGSAFTFADRRREATIQLRQPVFSGLRERNFFKAATETVAAQRFGLEDAKRVLFGDLAEAFYQALQFEGEVSTFEDTVAVERRRLAEIRARRDVGLARKTEVLLAESQLAEDEASLTKARNDVGLARGRIGFLVGTPLDLPIRDDLEDGPQAPLIGSPASPPDARLEAMVGEARAQRSDLARADREVEAARRQVAVAKGQYSPTIGLQGSYNLDRRGFSQFSEETDWTAELNFTFPLFEGGRIRASVKTAESQLRQAELDRDELARSVRVEVENAWLTYQSDLAQFKTETVRVASAEENDRLVREEYRSGLATNLEVITAQNQLLSGRLDLERQRYQVKLDWLALQVVQGVMPAGPAGPEGRSEARTEGGFGE